MSTGFSIASFILSLFSVAFTGFISWDRWHGERAPKLQVDYEEYGDLFTDTPYLEITNVGNADLRKVEMELREPLIGYIPPFLALFEDDVHATDETRRVDIGKLGALETKRVRARRNHEVIREDEHGVYYVGGNVNLYAHCTGRNRWLRWRVPIVVSTDDIGPIRQ
jgi:hypothetical protein